MANFEIKVSGKGSVKILKLKGYLDAYTSLELEETIRKLVESGETKFVVNMRELSYISSAGFGVFMAFAGEVRKKNGDIKFSSLPKKIEEIFELLGFKYIFEVFKNDEEAVKSFEKARKKNGAGRKK